MLNEFVKAQKVSDKSFGRDGTLRLTISFTRKYHKEQFSVGIVVVFSSLLPSAYPRHLRVRNIGYKLIFFLSGPQ